MAKGNGRTDAKKIAASFLLVAILLCLSISGGNASELEPSAPGVQPRKRSLAVGLDYTGVLFRKGFKSDYSAEAHYMFGEAGPSSDDVSTHVFGLRGYRHFRTDRRLQPFTGIEGGYVMAKTRIQRANGYLAGGFAGLEYYITRRITLGFDMGPYYIWVKENGLGVSGGGVDFILNSFVNFYFL